MRLGSQVVPERATYLLSVPFTLVHDAPDPHALQGALALADVSVVSAAMAVRPSDACRHRPTRRLVRLSAALPS